MKQSRLDSSCSLIQGVNDDQKARRRASRQLLARIAQVGVAASLAVVTVLLSGCTGYISTPLPASPNPPVAFPCPVLPTTIVATIAPTTCAGVRLTGVSLTCAGGTLPVSLSTTPGGATRIDATLADGSVVRATAIPVDGRCFDGIPIQIGITVGVRYTAEQGVETTGPTTGAGCIVRSRADFSQYQTSDPLLVHPGVEQLLKDFVHQDLDTRFVPGRCVRWRPL